MKILILLSLLISSGLMAQDSVECDYLRQKSFREFSSLSSTSEFARRNPRFNEIANTIDQEIQRSCRQGFKGSVEEGSINTFLQENNWIRGCVAPDLIGNANVLDLECQNLLRDYLQMVRTFRSGRSFSESSSQNCSAGVSGADRSNDKTGIFDSIGNAIRNTFSSTASPQ